MEGLRIGRGIWIEKSIMSIFFSKVATLPWKESCRIHQKSLSGPGVVICHPHPLYGGDMNNNVVLGIKGALQAEGFIISSF